MLFPALSIVTLLIATQGLAKRLMGEGPAKQWPNRPWMKRVLESEYNRKNAVRFKQECPKAPDKVLGWYLSLLRNCLAHRELAPQTQRDAEVTVTDSAEGGDGTTQRRVLRRSQATTAEDMALIDLCPLAPSPLGIVEVLAEAWKTYTLDAYITRSEAPSPSGTHSEASSDLGPLTSSAASRELFLGTKDQRRKPGTSGGDVDRLHGTMGSAGSSFRGREQQTQNLNGSHWGPLSGEIPCHTCLHRPCPLRISLLRAPQLKRLGYNMMSRKI